MSDGCSASGRPVESPHQRGRASARGAGARGRAAAGRRPAFRGLRSRPRGGSDILEGLHPFVAHLLAVLREHVPQAELGEMMHLVGRRFASEWPRLRGDLLQRVEATSALLEDLGALNTVESLDGGLVIRGPACLLAAAVRGRPEVCRPMESLLAELIEAPVRECCERGKPPVLFRGRAPE